MTYSLTHLLTGVKCRATSVAKNLICQFLRRQLLAIWRLCSWVTNPSTPPTEALWQTMQGECFCNLVKRFLTLSLVWDRIVAFECIAAQAAADKTSFFCHFCTFGKNIRLDQCALHQSVNCVSLVTMGNWPDRHMCKECAKKERENFRDPEKFGNTKTKFLLSVHPSCCAGDLKTPNWPQCCLLQTRRCTQRSSCTSRFTRRFPPRCLKSRWNHSLL